MFVYPSYKKLNKPEQARLSDQFNEGMENQGDKSKRSVSKKCRRSMVKKNGKKSVTLLYANIQGVRGKVSSLQHVMSTSGADIVFLTETMVRNVKVDGCQCINPKVSTGQNVSIVLAGKCRNKEKMKLYEPNESINMIGVRLVINGTGLRLYTAHMKQQSTNSREDIKIQFDEVRNQFRSATMGREPMILLCDANVHVGGDEINGCNDKQDWGGKELMSMVKEEGLILVNGKNVCTGIVTRVDPRNGSCSTIDLVICNSYSMDLINAMKIDETGSLKLRKYGKRITESDHNTIVVDLEVPHVGDVKLTKPIKFNTRNLDGRELMKGVVDHDEIIENLFMDESMDVGGDLSELFKRWDHAIRRSFHVVKENKHTKVGVDQELKALLDEEKLIRMNVLSNPERGQKIANIQKQISDKITENIMVKTEDKINNIIQSDRPQSKVFQVRRNEKATSNIDFPLKDQHGVLQVSKDGIDKIITNHFQKVFAQNGVPKEEVWQEYWKCVDDVFDLINDVTGVEYDPELEPKLDEVVKIINEMKETKATYGPMTIDLVKLCGRKMARTIHRCILMCYRKNVFPECLQVEKMTLLLKNKGVINNINDYRGIFLRNIIVSIYQKWLYSRNAPIVDANGSEFACGGRKNRSGIEALLIVKLIQDYSRWTKCTMVLKFLDVEKFFDSMNFKKSLIEAYLCGVTGRYWQCYKVINEKRQCIPHTPSGACSAIQMDEVFVQGSCDAVLMAWPLMDAESKRVKDPFTVDCCIDGIAINQLSFVDDLIEFAKSSKNAEEKTVSNEIFEKKTRLNFKTSKCKIIEMNNEQDRAVVYLDDEKMEVLDDHVYLGSIISSNGLRVKDMFDRIKKSKSVGNEIVQICKETELSKICLRYVKLLIGSCLDSKVKYGCALWNVNGNKKAIEELDKIKPTIIKRVLKLPLSTPSAAIQSEFGINDLSLDVIIEKVILAVETQQYKVNLASMIYR